MKALRLHADPVNHSGRRSANASRDFRNPRVKVEEALVPRPRANELLLKVRYCGLCGSDFHLAEASAEQRLAYPGLAAIPVTIGHEFSGEVVAAGEGSAAHVRSRFPVGSLVTAEEMHWCGECATCRAGHVNHCEQLEELGFTRDGAHAEYVVVPARYCWSLAGLEKKFGRDQALQLGALVEPYAVSYRALFQGAHAGKWLPGARVLVLGCGPIGLAVADLAAAAGAVDVQAIENLPERREFARKFGVRKAVASSEAGQIEGPFDWIIDAAGATRLAAELAAQHLSVGGTLSLLARTDEPAPLRPEDWITKNARIVGSQGHSGESTFRYVLELMAAGKLHAGLLVREIIGLLEAAERLRLQKKSAGKILVRPC